MGETSQIIDFFTDRTILLTGCTGFLGKILMEKLLRTCNVKKIYLLVRQKKNKCEEDRFKDMFDYPLFDRLKQEQPEYGKKLQLVTGNCLEEECGISEQNWQILHEEVEIVFHCAATVRFDQALRAAYYINVRSTRHLLEHAKQMKKFKSFVHISTAYSNCPKKEIDEIYYKPPFTGYQLENFLKAIDDDKLIEEMLPTILGEWPNTYSFTKCIAEDTVYKLSKQHDLPVAIFRPSIIISTYKEPMPAWIDTFYGPVGLVYGAGVGLLRTANCRPETKQDIVPADFVTNGIITTAWATATKHEKGDKEITFYNYVAAEHSTPFSTMVKGCFDNLYKCVPSITIWKVTFNYAPEKWKYDVYKFFLHTIPAHIVDSIAKLVGKEPRLVNAYNKIHKLMELLTFFISQEWKFENKNMKALWTVMNQEDRKNFEIRMDVFDWDSYMYDYLLGIRLYLSKEPITNLTEARKRYQRLEIYHWIMVAILSVLFIAFIYFIYSLF